MTATAAVNAAVRIVGENTMLPANFRVRMAVNQQAGRGQFVTISSSTGYAALNDGTVAGQISAGVVHPTVISDVPGANGQVEVFVRWGVTAGAPASTVSNDAFTDADLGAPFYIADENTAGKLASIAGVPRTIGGLFLGLDDDRTPFLWSGPVAQRVARAALVTDAQAFASFTITDAAASTATAERAIHRTKVAGQVTSVEFTGAAVVADNTDYVTITIAKRSLATSYGTAVTIATYDSRAANQGAVTAFTPAAFALSAVAGALNLLATDTVTATVAKGGAGKTLTGTILVNGKAI